MKILITGAAGFIGYHLASKLLSNKNNIIIGIDNLNSYYDVNLKKNRLKKIIKKKNFFFYKLDIKNFYSLLKICKKHKIQYIVNLAAQAGVRHSIKNPKDYFDNNNLGFFNILEVPKYLKVKHLIYASSSSVYGGNKNKIFSEKDNVDHPVSFYASTKKCNEVMAHSYSHIYKVPTTGLRFFSVYGPWGRPDMSLFIFVKSILKRKKIFVNNYGNMKRDFTYIDDVINCLSKIICKIPKSNSKIKYLNAANSFAPYKIFNVGFGKSINLLNYIMLIEKNLGIVSKKIFRKIPVGDVRSTTSDSTLIKKYINFEPKTSIQTGIKNFISWYKFYYNI